MFSRVSGMKEAPAALCLPGSLRPNDTCERCFFSWPAIFRVCATRRSRTHHSHGCYGGHQTRMWQRKRPAALKRSVKLAQIFKFDASTESKYGFMGGGKIMTEETVSEILLKRAVNLTLVLLWEFMILLFVAAVKEVSCRRYCDAMIPYWGHHEAWC